MDYIKCPHCGEFFDIWDEETWEDDLLEDACHTDIVCPFCKESIPIKTELNPVFEVDEDVLNGW